MQRQEFKLYYRLRRVFANYDGNTAEYDRLLDKHFPDWSNSEIFEFFAERYPQVNRVFYAQQPRIGWMRFSARDVDSWQWCFREFKRLKYCETIGLTVRSNLYCVLD